MAGPSKRITLLPYETQAQIRSAIQISSLQDAVLGLVKNSLDANAGHITIRLNFLKGYCSVLDDGCGISKSEFLEDGGLARLYFTSRSIAPSHFYGRYGRFLACLSGASLLSIASRHELEDSVCSVILRDGQRIAVDLDAVDEELGLSKHGTRVVVHNIFGHLPVRAKYHLSKLESRSGVELEFNNIKKVVIGIILSATRPFSIDLREGGYKYIHKHDKLAQAEEASLNVGRVVSTLFQANMLESPNSTGWRQASIRSSNLTIHAAINLQPAPSKYVQFIALNNEPLSSELAKPFLDQINSLFDASSFGVLNEDGQDKPKIKHLSSGSKGLDRWPMCVMQINTDVELPPLEDCMYASPDDLISSIHALIHTFITTFLKSNGFTGRKKALKPRNRSIPLAEHSQNQGFDCWSRVKSSHGTQADLLSGLPFLCRTTPTANQSNDTWTGATKNSELRNEEFVEWLNPRTGNVLQINSRTGMIHSNILPTHPEHLKSTPSLRDVINNLKADIPFASTELPVQSIAPDYESRNSVNQHHMCAIGSQSVVINDFTGGSKSSISKEDLRISKALGQVDGKFVLASVVSDNQTLFLVDQHAADERVKVEELFQQFSNNKPIQLAMPINFEVSLREAERLQSLQMYFSSWEVHYTVSADQIRVSALPELIVERCRLEPKLLIDLLRHAIWQECTIPNQHTDWLSKVSACPQKIVDLLISRACRSAIMFNDELTVEQCQKLLQKLSNCVFPFQCAHGRPSLTILAKIQDEIGIEAEKSFGQTWKVWTDQT